MREPVAAGNLGGAVRPIPPSRRPGEPSHGSRIAGDELSRLLAEHSRDVIFRYRLGPDPAVEYLSPAVEAVTGHRPEEFYADPALFFALLAPEDREPLRESWRSAEPVSLTVRWRRSDGSTTWAEQRAVTVRDDRGAVVAVEGALRDVTVHTLDRRRHLRLEERLRQVERMEALGQLAGGIAHDFNNLLAMIIGYADLIGSALPADAVEQADLTGIRDAADRGAGLIRQLLAFGRPDPSPAQRLDVNAVVADTERLLRRTIGGDIDFVVEAAPDLFPIAIELSRLEQILVNLVLNAKAAMPEGGRITIRTANTAAAADEPADATPPPGRHVRITVADTGIGMDAEVARRAFEPFFTTKGATDGTGLGLSTVSGAVAEAGGQVRLTSSPGAGTTFDVYLPVAEGPGTSRAAPDGGPPGAGTPVAVGGEAALHEVITRVLRIAGCTVRSAADPEKTPERHAGAGAAHGDALPTD